MTKRILSLLLAAMMVLGSLVVVSAADEPDYAAENTWAVEVLSKIGVLQGDENGDPMLDNAILRYEMALFLARSLTGYTDDEHWAKVENETPFEDLLTHPYNGAATWNYNHGIIFGVDNTTFNPNGNITYQDAIVMIVRAWADYYIFGGLEYGLGIKDELHYPWKHIELANELGLLANINPDEVFLEATTRGVVAQLVYNLLTWDRDLYKGDIETRDRDTIGKKYFGLQISAKTGDVVEVKSIADDGKVTTEKAVAGLTKATFEQFETEAKVGSTYKIIYYTVGNETVVTSLVKVSKDAATATNTPAAKEYEFVTEACKWNDKGEATAFKVTGIKVGETTYALLGDNAVTVKVYDRSKTAQTIAKAMLEGVDGSDEGTATDGITKAQLDEVLKFGMPEYSTLKVVDDNKDGKIDKNDSIIITPYVFAALYTETVVKDAEGKDTKATEWTLTGYGVVAITDAVLTVKDTNYYTRTWTGWKAKNAEGTAVDVTMTEDTAEFVAKSSVTPLATATKLSATTVAAYDIRNKEGVTKYIKFAGSETLFGYGYANLLGWDIYAGTNGVAKYFDVARATNNLLELYNNKAVADKDLKADTTAKDNNNDTKYSKYVNVWVINDNIVAIEYATKTGESGGTGSTTPETVYDKYDGILVVTKELPLAGNVIKGATTGSGEEETELVKEVNGKYYLVTKANVNGTEKDVLIYLADVAVFTPDYNSGIAVDVQSTTHLGKENEKIAAGYTKVLTMKDSSNKNTVVFYTLDASGNYVIVPNVGEKSVAVNGENYKNHIGDSFIVPDVTKDTHTLGTAFTYVMDRNASDFIKYDYTKPAVQDDPDTSADESEEGGTTKLYIENVADAAWLFVTKYTIEAETGAPEYESTFTVDARTDIVKNDDTVVVFDATAKAGFKYTMFANASYVLYNGETALDDMVRDGYLYFTVNNLLTNKPTLICVPETAELAKKLEKYADEGKKCIIAVEAEADSAHQNAHALLGEYAIEGGAIAAIASLEYGKTAFEDVSKTINTKAKLVERIAEQYNLTEVAASKMTGTIYTVASGALTKVDAPVVGNIYVFFTAANGTTPANYVAFVVPEAV